MDRILKNGTKLLTSEVLPVEGRKLKLNMGNVGAEGAKSSWDDQSGNGNSYTLTDVSRVGNAMQFNGTAGSIAKRTNFLKTTAAAQPFTIATRVKWSATKTWQCLFEVGTTDAAGSYSFGMHFYVNSGSNLFINPVTSSSHQWNSVVTINTEYHLALTYDGGTFIAYIDGVALVSTAKTAAAFDRNDIMFGSRNKDFQLEGYIKDYYVYDRALSVTEIEKLRDFGGSSGKLLVSRSV